MILRAALLLAACLWAGTAQAQAPGDPAIQARAAAEALSRAAQSLQAADGASDRVAALTETVQAYESGLAALREGLRRAAIREQAIALEFEARREELAQLLGVLATMQRDPETLLLLHPSGPLGTARSGMILSEVTPALQARAETLRKTLEEAALLRALQESAETVLSDGLNGIQAARTALSQAMSDRVDLPRRVAADPEALRRLLASADTLEGFASGLTSLSDGVPLPAPADLAAARGTLPLPVRGTLLRAYGEADAAGIRRPGWLIATRPLALVTTPLPATIRYVGPLLDYGNVIVLEPASGMMLVLAGLAQVYGEEGQVLPAGSPVGLMGGADPEMAAIPGNTAQAGGVERPETLYMELRQGDGPVDPSDWFKVTKE